MNRVIMLPNIGVIQGSPTFGKIEYPKEIEQSYILTYINIYWKKLYYF